MGSYRAAFDEMFDRRGKPRAPYKGIYAELAPTGTDELEARAEALGRALYVVLRHSHMSLEMTSLAERAFSRAALIASMIE